MAGAVGGLGLPIRDPARDPAATRPSASALDPITMAMHLHGSFSEGAGSMEAHLSEARRLGVDVLWWTDHDFRVAAHGYRKAVRFDGPEEYEGSLWWRWEERRGGPLGPAKGTFVDDPHSPDEPGRALRLSAKGTAEDWGELTFLGSAWNRTYTTSVADTSLELDVLVESVGTNAEFLTELVLSHHPAAADRPAGQYRLRYVLNGAASRSRRAEGLLGVVELPAPRGRWHRLTLPLVEDLRALWPDMVAEDNALTEVRLAVRARRGATARAVADRLRFRRGGRDGDGGLALHRETIRRLAERFPDQRQCESLEVSLVRHLNWFGETVTMPDFDGPPVKDNSVAAAAEMVRLIHRNGGLASYNHPLPGGADAGGRLGRHLVETRALGCEIVEIGCGQNLGSLLQAFDISARNAVFFTATGVTDDHSGLDWLRQDANYLTGVWARSARIPDLLDALRAGRAWFVDPLGWRGELDLSVGDREGAMGGVLVASARTQQVRIVATDLPRDGVLEIVSGPVDLGGPSAATETRTVPAGKVRGGGYDLRVQPGAGRYLRVQVRDASGEIVGVGNPVWLLREEPPAGVPSERLLLG
ncbi:MAG: hypothetical protein GEV03_14455 [Streptosporangiales bacterium]|nr:hypothetical protein [Streptosporangiales bacterium]